MYLYRCVRSRFICTYECSGDQENTHTHILANHVSWARILVQVTINRRLLIGRDGHLDQSEDYDLS